MARSTLDPDAPKRRRRKNVKGYDTRALDSSDTGADVAGPPVVGEAELREEIAKEAYYRAEKRGFAPGYEEQDWKEAEAEVRASRSKRR